MSTHFGSEIFINYENALRGETSFLEVLEPQDADEPLNNTMRIVFCSDHNQLNQWAIFKQFFQAHPQWVDREKFRDQMKIYHGPELSKYSRYLDPGEPVPPIDEAPVLFDNSATQRALWIVHFCAMICIGLHQPQRAGPGNFLNFYGRIVWQLGYFFFKRVWWGFLALDSKWPIQESPLESLRAEKEAASLVGEVESAFFLLFHYMKLIQNHTATARMQRIADEIQKIKAKIEGKTAVNRR